MGAALIISVIFFFGPFAMTKMWPVFVIISSNAIKPPVMLSFGFHIAHGRKLQACRFALIDSPSLHPFALTVRIQMRLVLSVKA